MLPTNQDILSSLLLVVIVHEIDNAIRIITITRGIYSQTKITGERLNSLKRAFTLATCTISISCSSSETGERATYSLLAARQLYTRYYTQMKLRKHSEDIERAARLEHWDHYRHLMAFRHGGWGRRSKQKPQGQGMKKWWPRDASWILYQMAQK